jgi:hypothetical protein
METSSTVRLPSGRRVVPPEKLAQTVAVDEVDRRRAIPRCPWSGFETALETMCPTGEQLIFAWLQA